MATVSLGQAARLAGVGKTTIARTIKAGPLAAIRTEADGYQIDPAELNRVYPIRPQEAAGTAAIANATSAVLMTQIEGLKAVVKMLKRQLDETRLERDHWRHQVERLVALAASKSGSAP
jgi:hypothetical protein